jgi:hypothetical protein
MSTCERLQNECIAQLETRQLSTADTKALCQALGKSKAFVESGTTDTKKAWNGLQALAFALLHSA